MSSSPKELKTLLEPYNITGHKSLALPIEGMATDSRFVKKGDVFLAYPGESSDGRQYIAEAVDKGAAAILYDPEGLTDLTFEKTIPFIEFPRLREHVGAMAAHWFGFPTAHLDMIGITGTNGKTSCSHYLAQCLSALGKRTAVLGTLGTGFLGELVSSTLTTPCALDLQKLSADLLSKGAHAIAMEVSSHALAQGRVNSVYFKTAIFTNLTHDHLDYHRNMEAYGSAKTRLFYWPSLRNAIINIDDPFGMQLFKELKQQSGIEVMAYTISANADVDDDHLVRAEVIKEDREGISAMVYTPWGTGELSAHLLGRFNLSNVLAVLAAVGMNVKVDLSELLRAISGLKAVPGRMQCFGGEDKPLVVVDYSHTPDSLKKALETLRAYHPHRLFCVFGCGGDRDPVKRPIMGQVAAEYSDVVVVTNDNPRNEDPEKIVVDIMKGISSGRAVEVEYDRREAIIKAVASAKVGDIVLVAGKGHEDYQIVGKERLHFSDAEVVLEALK